MSKPFDTQTIRAIDAWSKHVLLQSAQRTPEEQALAAFFAGRNLAQHAPQFASPVGHVVHYAPKNVDTTFAYVLLVSMLCGNTNAVRLTSTPGVRQRQLSLVDDIERITGLPVSIVPLADNDYCNDQLAHDCDVRVVWGGDDTVTAIRQSTLRPHGRELAFHDRKSIAVIDAQVFMAMADDSAGIAQRLLTDVTWMEQASCTSVRGIVWLGAVAAVQRAVSEFERHGAATQWSSSDTIDRLIVAQQQVAQQRGVSDTGGGLVNVKCLFNDFNHLVEQCNTPGVVFHTHQTALSPVTLSMTPTLQTVVKLLDPADSAQLWTMVQQDRLCDRVVSPGKSMGFSWTWDGYNLVTHLTHGVVWDA